VVPESQTTTMIEPRTLPLKKPAPASTILSVATEAGLTTLVAAIAAAGDPLLAAVKDPKTKVTVFGPTNEVRVELCKLPRERERERKPHALS